MRVAGHGLGSPGARPSSSESTEWSIGPSVCGIRSRVRDGQVLVHQVADQSDAAVRAQGVRAGVLDVAGRIEPDEAVADARVAWSGRTGRWRSGTRPPPPSGPGWPRCRGRSSPGCSGCARRAGWCAAPPPRSTRSLNRTGIAWTSTGMPACSLSGAGLGDLTADEGLRDEVFGRVGDQVPDHVLEQRGRPGGRPDLRRRPEHVLVVVGHPQDEVGEAEVGEQLPLRDDA